MLPLPMEGKIEDTVDLNLEYPSVSERYWTKYYFIPKDKRRQGGNGVEKEEPTGGGDAEEGGSGGAGGGEGRIVKQGVEEGGGGEKGEGAGGSGGVDVVGVLKGGGAVEKEESQAERGRRGAENGEKDGGEDGRTANGKKTEENGSEVEKMDVDYTDAEADKSERSLEDDSSLSLSLGSQQEEGGSGGGASGQHRHPDSTGHVCVMVHTNKLCLVTLSPRHPALAPGMEITKVSYNIGKFNRLDNQVSGKGKRGAQMMGPQSPVCIITCADGSQYSVLTGVHGKLVEVNERLVTNPKLLSERPDAEGYLAVVLPPLRNGDAPLKRLITSEQYWGQER